MTDHQILSSERHELRLITISASSPSLDTGEDLVHCKTERMFLDDVSEEYRNYIREANPNQSLFHRNSQAMWFFHTSPDPDSVGDLIDTIPTLPSYRFDWGDYASLSYCWGQPHETTEFVLDGVVTQVQQNLDLALRELRAQGHFGDRFRLWVDALCIDQSNPKERGEQVKMMHQIYSRAWSVISWMGPEFEQAGAGMELANKLADYAYDIERSDELWRFLADDFMFLGEGWAGFDTLMCMRYWTRLWIVQEIAMGHPGSVFLCGSKGISWENMLRAVTVFYKCPILGLAHDLVKDEFERLGDTTSSFDMKHAARVYKILDTMDCNNRDDGILAINSLLNLARRADCKDKRDRVFGMLALMDPRLSSRIEPIYTDPVSKVYADFVKAYIDAFGDLNILQGCGSKSLTSLEEDSPSWVPSFVRYGLPHLLAYNADGTEHPSRTSSMICNATISGNNLTCLGFFFDSVDGIGTNFNINDERPIMQPRYRRNPYGDEAATTEAFRRFLILNRHKSRTLPYPEELGPKTHPDPDNDFYCDWIYYKQYQGPFIMGPLTFSQHVTNALAQEEREGHPITDQSYYEWDESYYQAAITRRPIITEKGYFGWAPTCDPEVSEEDVVQVGDRICVLFGCSVALYVRPKGANYELIGECYIQGIMEGQALEMVGSGELSVEHITLC